MGGDPKLFTFPSLGDRVWVPREGSEPGNLSLKCHDKWSNQEESTTWDLPGKAGRG